MGTVTIIFISFLFSLLLAGFFFAITGAMKDKPENEMYPEVENPLYFSLRQRHEFHGPNYFDLAPTTLYGNLENIGDALLDPVDISEFLPPDNDDQLKLLYYQQDTLQYSAEMERANIEICIHKIRKADIPTDQMIDDYLSARNRYFTNRNNLNSLLSHISEIEKLIEQAKQQQMEAKP